MRHRPLGAARRRGSRHPVAQRNAPERWFADLIALLRPSVLSDWWVLPGPLDVELTTKNGDTVLQPDLLIARRELLTAKGHDGPPVLVVEVLSPTTWQLDLGVKMAAYAEAGVPHYWVVAPTTRSITVYELGDDHTYTEHPHVEGKQVVALDSRQGHAESVLPAWTSGS